MYFPFTSYTFSNYEFVVKANSRQTLLLAIYRWFLIKWSDKKLNGPLLYSDAHGTFILKSSLSRKIQHVSSLHIVVSGGLERQIVLPESPNKTCVIDLFLMF